MNKYYIIGSGPVGIISAIHLLEKGFEVVLIDNSNLDSDSSKNIFIIKRVKNIFSEYFTTYYKNKKILPVSSKIKGGFSEVWGGTLSFLNENDFRDQSFSNSNLKEYYKLVVKYLNLQVKIINQNNNFYAESLIDDYDDQILLMLKKYNKINKNLIKKNFLIKLSTLFYKNNNIWNGSSELISIQNKFKNKFTYIDNFEVINIVEKENTIKLYSKNKIINIQNSKLFIAAGALSSTYLACSLISKNSFSMSNSDLQIMPLIWFGKTSKLESKKSFSQLFLNFNDKDKTPIRTQLYVLNENLIDTLNISKFLINILKKINKILKNRLFILFIYSHSKNSTNYDFFIQNQKILLGGINKIKNNNHWLVFFKLLKSVTRLLLLPIPIFKKFNNYASFHFGASTLYSESEPHLKFDILGKIKNESNIHFIDSCVLPEIPSGPITTLSMANALKIVSKVAI